MNIYLDIDGVLLANELNPASYAPEFIKYVIDRFPNSTYWLTTHCQGDASSPINHLAPVFDKESIELMRKIKPTTWLNSPCKTSAIDFTKPFLWFDDDLFYGEKLDLIKHNVLDNWIEVDLRKDPNQLKKFIDSFPISIT
jgi:hypothetical protein